MFTPNTSNRGAFLDQIREAREERHAERLKEVAVIRLQACVRGWLARNKKQRNIRAEFDTLLGEEPSSYPKNELPRSSEVFPVAVEWIKIYHEEEDKKRMEIYTRYLVMSMSSDDMKLSYVCCAMNKDQTIPWIQHIKKVVILVINLLSKLHVESPHENKLSSIFLHLLLTFSSTSTWSLLHRDVLQALRPTLEKLTLNIMAELVAKGLHSSLGLFLTRALCRGKPALSGPAIATVITLSIKPLALPMDSNHPTSNALSLLAIHILSVPALIHHLLKIAPDGLRMIHSNGIFTKVIAFTFEDQNLRIVFNALEGSRGLCLLANLVHLFYLERETDMKEENYRHFCHVVTRLLSKCEEYVSSKQSALTQWHPLLGWFSQPIDQQLQIAMPLVKTQLQLLWSGPVINILFKSLSDLVEKDNCDGNQRKGSVEIRDPNVARSFFKRALDSSLSATRGFRGVGEGGKAPGSLRTKATIRLSSPEVIKISNICSVYYRAIVTLGLMKMDILTGLCYSSPVLTSHLWRVLLMLGPLCGLKQILHMLSLDPKAEAPQFHLLVLFCQMSTHLISVLDDIEMYDHQKTFTLEDYKAITYFLNYTIYRVIRELILDVNSASALRVFGSSHTLLMLLYRRNCQKQFVDNPSHWIIPEAHGILVEWDKGEKHAQYIVKTIPHILPHEDRVVLFRKLINKEASSSGIDSTVANSTLISVRRSALIEDGYRQLASLTPQAMKGTIRVRFINQQGLDEAGIDQDGVFKEFLEESLKRIFDPSLNLFRLTSEERLYPSPTSFLTENHLKLFEFTGRMLAKAVYEGLLVDCPFASFFLTQLIGEPQSMLYSAIDELPSLDPELYKNLTYVKHYSGDVSELELTFSHDEDCLGELTTHELKPGGCSILVTNETRIAYVHLIAHFKLHTQIKAQTKAFVKGFRSLICSEWLSLFSAPELQRLISGDDAPLNLDDLRRHTNYYGGFHDKHRVISWLWDVLKNDFTEAERRLFLKFITSCSKPPLLGFAHLEPAFSIRCVELTDDEDTGDTIGSVVRGFFSVSKREPVLRLPSSSTCFNLLKLPNYHKKSSLRDKLKYAIHSNTGFELS